MQKWEQNLRNNKPTRLPKSVIESVDSKLIDIEIERIYGRIKHYKSVSPLYFADVCGFSLKQIQNFYRYKDLPHTVQTEKGPGKHLGARLLGPPDLIKTWLHENARQTIAYKILKARLC